MSLLTRLRTSLALPPPPDLLRGDLRDEELSEPRPAAVLVAMTDRPDPGLILTVRHEQLRHHAGQISFPGGRADPTDRDVVATALREAEEEIGIPPDAVQVWGCADPYRTITNFDVVPVLGLVGPDLALVPHEAEVAEVFEVPLAFALDPAKQQIEQAEFRGATRTFYQINWNGRRIWGATAAMLVNLTRRLQ